jgi:uncharacterized protein YjiS (DUF1127 family)
MHNNCPHGSSQPDIRRTASGAIDTGYYCRRARAERSDFLHAVLSSIVRRGWNAWSRIKREMERRSVRQQLSVFSARELRDIGATRNDIDAIASGAYAADRTRCARGPEQVREDAHG